MKQINYKKLIIPNIPYVFFVYLFDKVGQAVRLAPGADISEKILNITQGFSEAFSNALPSVHPLDLLIGIVGAVVIRLIVYFKGKNARKYRKGAEYGSARWGNAEDIKPYIDPDFQNNIILTQTERLTMNSRPKQDKGGGMGGAILLVVLLLAAVGGGAFYYFKIMKPKKDAAKGSSNLDDLDFDEDDEDEEELETEQEDEKV